MRRLLLAAAVSVPIAGVAAIATAPSGKVVDLDNYNAEATTSYINKAQCEGAALNLQWSVVPVNGGTSLGTHKIFASNKAPPTTGDGANFCAETPDENASPPTWADAVGSVAWTSNIQGTSTEVTGMEAAGVAHVDCSATGEDEVVYLCVHLYDSTSNARRGYASGTFRVQFAAPSAPTLTGVGPASETSLVARWTEPSGLHVDHYEAVATAGTEEHRSGIVVAPATSATISGLTLGTTYSVVVYAYSVGGNPSPASNAMDGTPAPVDDFWETYRNAGGRDDGGCASGSAGPLALLAVAALLRLRRRK